MSKKLKILFLPKVSFPTRRALLIDLWNIEFCKIGNKVTWVMQSETQSDKIRRVKWENSDVFLARSMSRENYGLKIINKLLTIYDRYIIARSLIKNDDIDIIQVRNSISGGFLALYF